MAHNVADITTMKRAVSALRVSVQHSVAAKELISSEEVTSSAVVMTNSAEATVSSVEATSSALTVHTVMKKAWTRATVSNAVATVSSVEVATVNSAEVATVNSEEVATVSSAEVATENHSANVHQDMTHRLSIQ